MAWRFLEILQNCCELLHALLGEPAFRVDRGFAAHARGGDGLSVDVVGDVAGEEAAFDLGANRWQVFREVTLPALMPGIVSGAMFAFLLSWANLPLSIFTTGADTTLPEWLYSRASTNYSPLVPAISMIATLVSALVVATALGLGALLRRQR